LKQGTLHFICTRACIFLTDGEHGARPEFKQLLSLDLA